MKLSEYAAFDATGLAEAIAKAKVSASEVESAARAAIAAVNPDINAIVETFDDALSYRHDGPFAGVPFAIKDLGVHAANVPFSLGSRFAADIRVPHDTELMTRFRRAGFATLARTASSEFGLSPSTESLANGATRNPWNPERTAGGSS
ncbi:MAG: amidase family protein, partial [Stackebrandtia sp.]